MSRLQPGYCSGDRIVLAGTAFVAEGMRYEAVRLREILMAAGAAEVLINPHPNQISMRQHVLICNELGRTRPVIKAASAVSLPIVMWDSVVRFHRNFESLRAFAKRHRFGAEPAIPAEQASTTKHSTANALALLVADGKGWAEPYSPQF